MRIWFELTNSPHINMFAAMIRDIEKEHEVIITCRPLANTIELLDLHRMKYEVVGEHYGGKLIAKLVGFPIRIFQLCRYLAGKKIDIGVSQCSFHSPFVSKLCGFHSIYLTDNEHAMANVPTFITASCIMVPEYLSTEKLQAQWASPKKIIHYPGVKEGIYLWKLEQRLAPKNTDPNRKKRVYIRPEPWVAHYYKGSRNFMDDLIIGMKDQVDIILLPRGKTQGMHYQDKKFEGIQVVDSALDIADIVPYCDLFIGAGGTMTREMAVLGVPTISVYQDELLDVDLHLLKMNAFIHEPQLTAHKALDYLAKMSQQPANRELLEKGKAAYQLIKETILNKGKK